MIHQRRLHLDPLFVDYFAGGGGVSEAARRALGRSPDVAISADAERGVRPVELARAVIEANLCAAKRRAA